MGYGKGGRGGGGNEEGEGERRREKGREGEVGVYFIRQFYPESSMAQPFHNQVPGADTCRA